MHVYLWLKCMCICVCMCHNNVIHSGQFDMEVQLGRYADLASKMHCVVFNFQGHGRNTNISKYRKMTDTKYMKHKWSAKNSRCDNVTLEEKQAAEQGMKLDKRSNDLFCDWIKTTNFRQFARLRCCRILHSWSTTRTCLDCFEIWEGAMSWKKLINDLSPSCSILS